MRIQKWTYLALALLLLLSPVQGWAQKKIYTRKARMADFTSVTTKVVGSGNMLLDMALKDEVTSRWQLSPYEFCSAETFEAERWKRGFYYLHYVSECGVVYLCVDKGGVKSDPDPMKEAMEVVRIPVSQADVNSSDEFLFMPAYIDIIQAYIADAMENDAVAYAGLAHYNFRGLGGRTVLLPDDGDAPGAFSSGDPGTAVVISIAPSVPCKGAKRFLMAVTSDTHELCWFQSRNASSAVTEVLSARDLKALQKKGGVLK